MQRCLLLMAVGLAALAIGADITVRGAVFIGERVGLSKAVIGLTIIAIGTSLPELATSLAATIKRHNDISIGNLVGSNIFNTLLVTGTAGVVRPFSIAKIKGQGKCDPRPKRTLPRATYLKTHLFCCLPTLLFDILYSGSVLNAMIYPDFRIRRTQVFQGDMARPFTRFPRR